MKTKALAKYGAMVALLGSLLLGGCQPDWESLVSGSLQGDTQTQHRYAMELLEHGKKSSVSRSAALEWFLVAAQAGYAPSQVGAASCYHLGLAGPVDLDKARFWYLKAAHQGSVSAYQGLLALALAKDDLKEAAPWVRKLALAGDVDMQMQYARMLTEGIGVKRNEHAAVNFWRYAAIAGNGDARLMMGMCYLEGWGVPQSTRLALGWWKLAAEAGNKIAKKLISLH